MDRDDPPWFVECLRAIAIYGGRPCARTHCASIAPFLAAFCQCAPPYVNGCMPVPTPGCCAYGPGSPVLTGDDDGWCWCCCGPGWMDDCRAAVAKVGGALCGAAVCGTRAAQAYLRAYCTCTPPYQKACQSAGADGCACRQSSPAFLNGSNCYCCCGSVLASTFTAADAVRGKGAEELVAGDLVYVAEDAALTRWTQRPVAFSAGAEATGVEVPVVRVRFRAGDGAVDWVVADRRRPFLLAGGGLRRAGDLSPGDALAREDGTPAPVVDVEAVAPRIVHQIATSREPARGVGGHLLLVHEVVAGDYALQLADLDALDPAEPGGVD